MAVCSVDSKMENSLHSHSQTNGIVPVSTKNGYKLEPRDDVQELGCSSSRKAIKEENNSELNDTASYCDCPKSDGAKNSVTMKEPSNICSDISSSIAKVSLHDTNSVERITPVGNIDFIVYESEVQMPDIMRLITKDLSEPYSIYTYRYFIHNWPKLCFLVSMHAL